MSDAEPATWRLKASQYFSPYSRSGAPGVSQPQEHGVKSTDQDQYTKLRSSALATLEAMGFEPQTMVERGVTWAQDQDPFGHVMHSQYMQFFALG